MVTGACPAARCGGGSRGLATWGHYGEQLSKLGMLCGREAHQEHDELGGEVSGGLGRRNSWRRPSEKMKSTTALREATARFPVQEEQVEGGEDDGDHAGA
jgi:hypothetical protein